MTEVLPSTRRHVGLRPDRKAPRGGLRRLAAPVLTPLSADQVRFLHRVAERVPGRSDDVFATVGDSATVSRAFLQCFERDADVELGAHEPLAATVAFFRAGNAGSRSPYRRQSRAAGVGWSARHVLLGDPSPLLEEVRAIHPRYAFVLGGGNDVEGQEPRRYANRLLRIVDQLLARGVIPILGSILPRSDDATAALWVRRYNTVNRAIATGRRVPYIDFHRAMSQLPRHGLAADGVHPNVLVRGNETLPCFLTPEGLQHGHNVRNLLALQMLDRLRTALSEPAPTGVAEAESSTPGTFDAPFAIRALPFGQLSDTRTSASDVVDRYGCDEEIDESGPEHVYRFDLAEERTLRFWAYGPSGADVDLHLLRSRDRECIDRHDELLIRKLEPGRWLLVVDTFSGDSAAGEYVLTVEQIRGRELR